MQDANRIAQIVEIQIKATEIQHDIRRHLIPAENFFPNMLGRIAQTQGIELARAILTTFEMGAMDEAELLDSMMRKRRILTKAIQEVAARKAPGSDG